MRWRLRLLSPSAARPLPVDPADLFNNAMESLSMKSSPCTTRTLLAIHEKVVAAKPTPEFDAQVPQGAQSAERFLRWLHAELKAGR